MSQIESHKTNLAVAGFVFLIPALILVTGGILQSFFGIPSFDDMPYGSAAKFLLHPALILGGIALAVGLNLLSVLRLKVQLQNKSLVSTISIKGNLINLMTLALGVILASIIFLYLLAENYQIFAG